MGKLICEICESNDFVKTDDGFFQCQECGCKYTLTQLRGMFGFERAVKPKEPEPDKSLRIWENVEQLHIDDDYITEKAEPVPKESQSLNEENQKDMEQYAELLEAFTPTPEEIQRWKENTENEEISAETEEIQEATAVEEPVQEITETFDETVEEVTDIAEETVEEIPSEEVSEIVEDIDSETTELVAETVIEDADEKSEVIEITEETVEETTEEIPQKESLVSGDDLNTLIKNVEITKRNGDSADELIERIIWKFPESYKGYKIYIQTAFDTMLNEKKPVAIDEKRYAKFTELAEKSDDITKEEVTELWENGFQKVFDLFLDGEIEEPLKFFKPLVKSHPLMQKAYDMEMKTKRKAEEEEKKKSALKKKRCPYCDSELEKGFFGKQLKCKNCGKTF